jgi:hypothetical protein
VGKNRWCWPRRRSAGPPAVASPRVAAGHPGALSKVRFRVRPGKQNPIPSTSAEVKYSIDRIFDVRHNVVGQTVAVPARIG